MRFMLLGIPKKHETTDFADSLRTAGVLLEHGRYWTIQVRSKEEAIEWARRCPASEHEIIEIRHGQELPDPPEI